MEASISVIKSFYDPTIDYDKNFDNGPVKVYDDTEPYKNHGEPKYDVLGHKVYEPFGIPAGPLLNSNYIRYGFERGFDVLCYKTQRSEITQSNQFPQVLFVDIDGDLTLEKATSPLIGLTKTSKSPTELSITNSFGNPSRGPEFWQDDLKKAISYQGKGQLLIMSVVGTIKDGYSEEDYWDDFAHTAKLAADAGVEAIELNLSCPNVATEGVLCYTHDAVVEISKRVKEKVGDIPVVAKFGYFSVEQQELLEKIVADSTPFLSAYSAINTISAPIVDGSGEQALPGPNRLKSGVCGASIKWAGLDMVARLKKIREKMGLDYEIFGVGGVMTPADFQAYRKAGADCVQSATGAMWNPHLAQEIKEQR